MVKDNEPIIVARKKRGSVVLVSLAEWNSLQETLHLNATPANARALLDAIDDLDAGKGVAMSPDELKALNARNPRRKSGTAPRNRSQSKTGKPSRRAVKKPHREAAE